MPRIAGAIVVVLSIVGGALWLNVTGCGYGTVEDPQATGAPQGDSQCPKIPDSPPYGSVTLEGIPLDKPSAPRIVKDQSGSIIGRITTVLSQAKDGVYGVEFDFGTMEQGAKRSHVFKLINAGDGKLNVVKHRSTCQCTVAGVNTDGLENGESTEIKLEWTAKGESPQFEQTAEICTNDPKCKTIAFRVKGMVTRSVEISPEGIWSLGIIEDEKAATTDGWIASRSRENLKVVDIDYPKDQLKVESTKMTKQELIKLGGQVSPYLAGYKLNVTVLARNEVGRFHHEVKIKTNVDGNAEFPLNIVGSRTGPIMIRPNPSIRYAPGSLRADLGRISAKRGTTAVLNLYVRGMEGKPFEMKSAKSDPKFLKASLKPYKSGRKPDTKAGKKKRSIHYLLTITIPPYPPNRPLDTYSFEKPAKVTLTTNHPKAKTLTISFTFEPTDGR